MSNDFVVTSALYTPTPQVAGQTQNNPFVVVRGTANGITCWAFPFWDAIQSANIAGGSATVQQLIASLFAAFMNNVLLNPIGEYDAPVFPEATSIPAADGDTTNGKATCNEALVGSWTS